MKNSIWFFLILGLISVSYCYADEMTAMEAYNRMSTILIGEWSLSPEAKQIDTTGAYKHKAVYPLVGTDATAIAYKIIGKGATLQEDLLPDTAKQMVTMYHCNNFFNCTELRATHYCAKKNQPQFILNTKESTKDLFIFDCNMQTDLCNSDQDHVHRIIHELSDNGSHLKSSYLGWKNQTPNEKNSIYHFDRK